jgi:ZIP family zinc transporter
MHTILLAIIAGGTFALAGMLGLFGVTVGRVTRLASVAIAAGILLSITFSDLLPDALADAGRTRTAFGFMAGFVLLFLMEALSGAHVHHHDGDDEHLHHHSLNHHHSARPFILGLSLHNLTDGLAIGTTTVLSKGAASAVTIGVLVHQLPVGISFAAVLGALQTSRAATMRASLFCASMIPLGAAIILALPDLSDAVLGTLVAGAGGALCYVACGHLLPEAQSERHAVVAPVFVMALVLTTTWFTLVSTG